MAVGLVVAGVASMLKQPLIIGYIIAGIILGPNLLNTVNHGGGLEVFGQLGVVILLFTVGLNLSPKVFREVGKVSLITGIGQIVFTSLIGYFISYSLGYSIVESLYISIALTFSSTIIIMKILSDKEDIDTLYGKISIGFLLVQDVVAMLILAAISSFSPVSTGEPFSIINILIIFMTLAFLVLAAIYWLPRITKQIARSQEYLLLFSLGWCLLIAMIFYLTNFSMEIGALLAGVALSMSMYRYEIVSKIKPIRDFFIFIFFVYLGSQMDITNLENSLLPIIVLSLFILIGNPLIVFVIMGRLGYTKKSSFLAGLTVAQISEFSLILIALGIRSGHLSPDILSMVTVVGLITITGSTYAMIYADNIFPYVSKFMTLFQNKSINKKNDRLKHSSNEIILFGYDKIGFSLIKTFKKLKNRFLVVDYNPEVIKHMQHKRINCVYGDAEDASFLEELRLHNSKMVISTIPDYYVNSLLLSKIRDYGDTTIVILVCNSIEDSLKLYDSGANYVIIPRFIGGEYASMLIEKNGFNLEKFINERICHIDHLGDVKTIKHFDR
jgi:Kef-type K+ transport system membrane component KefB